MSRVLRPVKGYNLVKWVSDLGGWVLGLPAMSRVVRPVGGCNLVEWATWGAGWMGCLVCPG